MTRALLVMVVSAVLAGGGVYAAPSAPASQGVPSDATPAAAGEAVHQAVGAARVQDEHQTEPHATGGRGRRNNRAGSAKSRPRGNAAVSKANARQPEATGARLGAPGNPTSVRPLPSVQSSAPASHGSNQNEAIYRALPVRTGSVIRPAGASSRSSRHRDPNPAVIGGAATPNKGTASLDGARTNLKTSRN